MVKFAQVREGAVVQDDPMLQEATLARACNPVAIRALLDRLKAAEASDAESIAMYRKARDERDELRAENERLREALEDLCAVLGDCGMTANARAALEANNNG